VKKKGKKISLFFRLILLLFGLNTTALTVASVAAFVAPYKTPWPAIAGLAFPVFWFVQLIFLLYFLFTKHGRTAGLAAIMLLLTIPVSRHYMAVHFQKVSTPVKGHHIKIMTWNVRNFDLYNWSHNKETRQHMLSIIRAQNPDILCLQEFYTHDKDTAFDNIATLRKMGYRYWHFNNGFTLRHKEHWGLAIFSKYRIDNKQEIEFATYPRVNGCIMDDIHLPDTTFRLFCIHLQSVFFNDSDYAHITKPEPVDEKGRKDMTTILQKLKKAFVKRAGQADTVARAIQQSAYPVIVCGDFNDTPGSYTYEVIQNELRDAFLEAGFGLGQTYIGPVPAFRIDYVLHSPVFMALSVSTMHKKLSDHYPVVVELSRR
jgi:endonuclease/exonuclease/phosphatase family metal-dependent hydrolase